MQSNLLQPRKLPVVILSARRGWALPNLKELWEYRELVVFLAWRDLSSRYKQTVAGAAWAILQPVLMTLVFTVVFGHFAKVPTSGVAYPLFAFVAMLPWQYVSSSTTNCSNSLISNADLLTKVYFPRVIMPLASMLPGVVDFLIGLCILGLMLTWWHIPLSSRIVFLPFFFSLAFCTCLGVGLWYSALCIEYRDVRHLQPLLLQVWMFASPIGYASSTVPTHWRTLYELNPLVAVVDGFRWCLLNSSDLSTGEVGIALAVSLSVLLSGVIYFKTKEREFADVV